MTDPVNDLIDEAQAYVLRKLPGWDLVQRLAEEIQALRREKFDER